MNTMNQQSAEQLEKVTQNLMQACEEMGTMAREHMDATLRSATACLQGCTEIGQNVTGLMQESMTRSANVAKTIMTAKSMREVMDMQAELAKEFFDCWMAGTGKISEISARVTKEAVDPLAEHANNTMGKLAQRARAA